LSQPVTINIPHQLGRAEARRRLESGFDRIEKQLGAATQVTKAWDADRLSFTALVMGQTISGVLDVFDAAVRVELTLPGLLGVLAGKISGKVKKEGQLLLEKK
jgi:hypothetical protein